VRKVPIALAAICIILNGFLPAAAGGGMAELAALGPRPPAECPPYPPAKTGQTDCWDEDGNPTGCAGSGQDGETQLGVSVWQRFTENFDGTVTDNLTGLIWLQDASCFGLRHWSEALADAANLGSGTDSCFPDLTDGTVPGGWRLPSVRELSTLVDHGEFAPALPSSHPFFAVETDYYWSSTSFVPGAHLARGVLVHSGIVGVASKTAVELALWPVRGPE